MNARRVLMVLCGAGLFVAPGRAQLFVDIGGPRNVFIAKAPKAAAGAKEKKPAAEERTGETAPAEAPAEATAVPDRSGTEKALQFATLDSKEKSLTLNFLGLPRAGGLVFGGLATIAAQDELEEFLKFRKAPKVEANVLANYTEHTGERGALWSVTLRAAATEVAYLLQAPATGATISDTHRTAEGYVTLAWAFPGENSQFNNQAFALTLGYKPDTNYEALPLVDLGNGKSARSGVLERFKSYPLQLIYVHEVELGHAAWLGDLLQLDEKAKTFALLSPYIKLTLREGGSAGQVYGLNVALKTVLWGKKPSESKTAYPYSIYVETTRRAGAGHFTTGAGVSKVFSF